MKCSGNEDKSKKSSRQWRFLVKMKSRVDLWYGRWLEEMKEKVSHVCSQNNRRVE